MEAQNYINTNIFKEKINRLKEVSERIESSLTNIDSLITETVGQDVGVWDGDSAMQFRDTWNNLSDEIPSYIKTIKTQINNIDIIKNNINKIQS